MYSFSIFWASIVSSWFKSCLNGATTWRNQRSSSTLKVPIQWDFGDLLVSPKTHRTLNQILLKLTEITICIKEKLIPSYLFRMWCSRLHQVFLNFTVIHRISVLEFRHCFIEFQLNRPSFHRDHFKFVPSWQWHLPAVGTKPVDRLSVDRFSSNRNRKWCSRNW